MDRSSKLRIVNRARALKLWNLAEVFKERQRCGLRRLGLGRAEAIRRAWERLDRLLDGATERSFELFDLIEDLSWETMPGRAEMQQREFDIESGWSFIYFLDENINPPSEFAAALAEWGRESPRWILVQGGEYFNSAPVHQLALA
jgi:hypothetical protein